MKITRNSRRSNSKYAIVVGDDNVISQVSSTETYAGYTRENFESELEERIGKDFKYIFGFYDSEEEMNKAYIDLLNRGYKECSRKSNSAPSPEVLRRGHRLLDQLESKPTPYEPMSQLMEKLGVSKEEAEYIVSSF